MWKAEIWTQLTSMQSIMHANFGGQRLRDNDLETLKPRKNVYF